MNNFATLVALLGLTASTAVLAADTKTAPATNTNAGTSTNTVTKSTGTESTTKSDSSTGTKKHNHQAHETIAGKKTVMSLSSLTDKQKQQIGAVYAENKEQYASLTKQLRTMRETEWSKIKLLLTADQLKELQAIHAQNRKASAKAIGDSDTDASDDAVPPVVK
jgi:Spy/CpxP family protein refolding chaperone